MSYKHKIGLFGPPGVGKSLLGLSYREAIGGVLQMVFGSSEEATANSFTDKTGILTPYKPDWFEYLTADEKASLLKEPEVGKELVHEASLGLIKEKGNARMIVKLRRYIALLKQKMLAGEKDVPGAVFLDNGTPFGDLFGDYVAQVFASEFETAKGNFDSIKFSIKYSKEIMEFYRELYSLPCHVIVSFHVSMTVDEQTASKVDFMNDSKSGIKHSKEWQPMITGSAKYRIAGIPDYAFFMSVEEVHGQKPRYIAKMIADDKNVGVGKSRSNPFDGLKEHGEGGKILVPKGNFYKFFDELISKQGGKS